VQIESALLEPAAATSATLEDLLPTLDRLEMTVEDLLHLARDADVDRSPLDAAKLLSDVRKQWQQSLADRGRPLEIVIETNLPTPIVAEPALREILQVLISNAEHHGAGAVTVAARSSASGAVVLEVQDEGAGMVDPQRVFERRKHGNHGVGLALARSLAEAEGARLVLEHAGPSPVFAMVIPTEPE
jgi:signal transduction histidine kinase